ncbi:hypothetical protein [Clostridium sp. BL-8]|uniref:hypothetical protein n=1 Tax=Clostridium sp. BL-8 TaxID=349938 RepID=UPI00098CDD21|nr:hypothetical protein [Clostridium sp. BL-8]OOM70571.1 hypothetical protein CLOBL_50510 [Clostridium sp. BL-8]
MGFFKKDEIQEKEMQPVIETKADVKENDINVFKKKNLSLFDVDTIQYVIENFPSMSIEIQGALNNLANILENTIDYIEDKSSEIIKTKRDFKLSKSYRNTSISIYEVVQNIGEYIKWMQQEYEKNININHDAAKGLVNKKNEDKVQEKSIAEKNENLGNQAVNEKEIEIYKDFSLKEPKGFKLKDNVIMVENWDDLLVKTAEVLTKKYKDNRHSNISVKEFQPILKKSTQNSFRDTAIEMLNEYKISLDEFKVIIK